VTAEGCRATALDCRHHLHLVEANVTGIGATPCGAEVAEDIRDLQSWTAHNDRRLRRWCVPLQRREAIQRAHDRADGVGGNPSVEGCGVELGVPEQPRGIVIISLCH